jgi:LemA protein
MDFIQGIALVVFVLILIILPVIILYNKLIRVRNFAQNAWAQIDVQLKRRYDLIPNLVETVKGYAAHEKQVFENVTQARAMATGAQNMDQRIQAENMLSGALRSLFAVAEAYPQLQASQNFSELQKELADTENKIAFARQFYNDTTMKFNTSIQTFPANILAGMLGFTFIPYFELDDIRERSAAQVKF